MKIGIDISQTAFPGSGVARYTSSLISALTEFDKKNEYVFFYSSMRVPLDNKIRDQIKSPHTLKEFKFPPTLLSLLWNKFHVLPIENFIGPVDIFMSSDWTQPPTKKALKITTIHDMVVYAHPETTTSGIIAQQKNRHEIIKKESLHAFIDSLYTRKETEQYLGLHPDHLHLLYPAVENNVSASSWESVKKNFAISKPYILSVGKREPRKNLDALIDAFANAGVDDAELLIVGDKGWGNDSPEKVKGVKFLGFVSDEDLATLYQNAEFFVFPSLYEGFGYPVIEAMGYGCPVATSNTSSLAEIADGSALLFDPLNTDGIKNALIKLHTDKKLRDDLIIKGYARYKSFSRKNFVENFVKIVTDIYGNRS